MELFNLDEVMSFDIETTEKEEVCPVCGKVPCESFIGLACSNTSAPDWWTSNAIKPTEAQSQFFGGSPGGSKTVYHIGQQFNVPLSYKIVSPKNLGKVNSEQPSLDQDQLVKLDQLRKRMDAEQINAYYRQKVDQLNRRDEWDYFGKNE